MPKWPHSTSKAMPSTQNGTTPSRPACPTPQHEAFVSLPRLSMRSAIQWRKRREHRAPAGRADLAIDGDTAGRPDEIRAAGTALITVRLVLISGRRLGQLGLVLGMVLLSLGTGSKAACRRGGGANRSNDGSSRQRPGHRHRCAPLIIYAFHLDS